MTGRPPLISDVAAERVRRAVTERPAAARGDELRFSLISFTSFRMPNYAPSRVHRHVAEQLERVERGEVDRVMIRQPPRTGKTELAARSFPAFSLGRKPSRQVLVGSASADLARSVGRDVRNIIKSPAYKLVFPNVDLSSDSKAAGRWTTAQGGAWYSVGVGGDVLGRGADLWLIDDPYGTMADASSKVVRDGVWSWFNGTVYNRLEPGGAIVIIGHRMHEDDLQGRLEERMRAGGEFDQWEIIELPALAEEADPLGREIGQPLWPERYSFAILGASGPTRSGATGPPSISSDPRPMKARSLLPIAWTSAPTPTTSSGGCAPGTLAAPWTEIGASG